MEADRFHLIAFTSPERFPLEEEAAKIRHLISAGFDFVHLRKPDYSLRDMEGFLECLDNEELSHVRLHSHFPLSDKYPVGGLHLNSRNPDPGNRRISLSKSLHTFEEIRQCGDDLDYFTFSPVFPSISKQGYMPRYGLAEIASEIRGRKCVALGGVTASRLGLLADCGFFGAAFLGGLWNKDFCKNVDEIINSKLKI